MTVSPQTHKIGFIGLGIMGKSMARHLMKAGYIVSVYSRTKAKASDLLEEGALWQETPGAIAKASDIVITMVGYPRDVEEVYFGADGILSQTRPGMLLVDMTTSQPSLAQRIADAATEKGAQAIDAPVSGGDVGARNATLAIMCGGAPEAFEEARPVLEVMGKTISLLGPAGAGQHTKMVNQIVIAGTVLGVAEGLSYARHAGLNLTDVLEAIGQGAAGGYQLNVLGKRMSEGDFAPGFFVHHFLKDMNIAESEARARGLDLAALQTALKQFQSFADTGGREDGTQGIFKLYDQNA